MDCREKWIGHDQKLIAKKRAGRVTYVRQIDKKIMKAQKLVALFSDLFAAMLSKEGMRLLPGAFDPEKYLGSDKIPSDVYQENPEGLFYTPFNFSHDDFGRLILIRISDHPEIEAIELIVQNDNKGAVVVIYYHHGKVENYLTPSFSNNKEYIKLDENWELIENHDIEYHFEDTPKGIVFTLDIKTTQGLHIKIKLQENRKEEKRFSVLATVGSELKTVKRFPLVYLKDGGLIPIDGTDVHVELDGKKMDLSKPPVKVEGEQRYRSVYSFSRLPFFWNEEQDDYITPEKLDHGLTFQKENSFYTLSDNQGYKEIEKILYEANGHSAGFSFSPAFPDIASLKVGSKIKGKFCIGIDDIDGIIGGKYAVQNRDQVITIKFHPEKCWGPIGNRNWVNDYYYLATLTPKADNKFKLKSAWQLNKN